MLVRPTESEGIAMMHNHSGAVCEIERTHHQDDNPDRRLPMRADKSTIEIASTAAAATVLLLLSPEIGIGAAIGGTLVGAVSAALAITRRRERAK